MKKARIWLVLTALWLCVIFGHSMMPASVSDSESQGIFQWLRQYLPWLTHHLVRKTAHFAIFAVLGLLLTGAFWNLPQFSLYKPLGCALLAAFFDETIQLFVEGRSGQISDVWLDFSGALCGALFLWLTMKTTSHKNN